MTDPLPQLRPGAEPRFYRGNHIGCLVMHGFMASPGEVNWAGAHLAEAGYTVYVPRLTGHGINPDHMKRMRWQDWFGHVLDGYHLLNQQCEQIYLVGHSMGGLLALLLAASQDVAGLVVAATPVEIPDPLMRLTRWIHPLRPFLHYPSEDTLNQEIITEQLARGEDAIGRVHYARWSSRAVYELYLLITRAADVLPQITAPLLLLYAEQDTTAVASNADVIRERVASKSVQTHLLQDGAHILFQDAGRNEAFSVSASFIAQCVAEKK